jgi:hypothetical protein
MKVVKAIRKMKDDYLDLVRRFPLRRLRNDQEQDQAVRILSGLVGRVDGRLSAGEREYADALGCFIREYDDRVYPLPRRKSRPLALMKSLMDDHLMGIADLVSDASTASYTR